MTNKQIFLLFLMMVVLALPVFGAENSGSFLFKQNDPVNLKVACFDGELDFCDASTTCVININYPDGGLLFAGEPMTRNPHHYNLSIGENVLNQTGRYPSVMQCEGTTERGVSTFYFRVTFSGKEEEDRTRMSIIWPFIFSIIFFAIVGLMSGSFVGRFFGYGIAFLEFVLMLGAIYVSEAGQLLTNLLKINFYIIGIIGFGIVVVSIIMLIMRIINPNDESDQEKKWAKQRWRGR